ncbi:phage antirepressor KilAC domain-containing protein [Paraburkholderia sediminicola]|uniref:phage antirepressor KilAC domain-containing protein n=1 Tax=Paraburkholderia sediminicola TaxID=458836 RepID=UPI0038B78501
MQASFEVRERRRAEVRKANAPHSGCWSVTAVARDFGMRRADLFVWLQREDWLQRDEDGWRATSKAVEGGWVAQREPVGCSWPQITRIGFQEIARHLDVRPDSDSAT